MRISFVIPCYNAELFVNQCLDSIEALKLDDYQIVAVNDGSSDQTLSVLNKRALLNSNIAVVDQANQGASAARNTGIHKADGDFIVFVDSDDVVLPGLSDVLNEIEEDDQLILFNVYQQFPDQTKEYRIHQTNEVIEDKSTLIKSDRYINAPWGKVISRKMIEEHQIQFDTQLRICEDLPWSIALLNASHKVRTVDCDGYLYNRSRAGSTSNSVTIDKIHWMFDALKVSADIAQQSSFPEVGLSMCAYQYILNLGYIGTNYARFKDQIKSYSYLLKYDFNHRVHLVHLLATVLPLRLICFMLIRYIR